MECAAVVIGADNTLSAVLGDGSLHLIARRDWEHDIADRWFDVAGKRLRRPLIHGEPDRDVLLHFEGCELSDGKKGPWTLFGYKHVNCLNLTRRGDYSVAPVFCTTAHCRDRNGIRDEMGWVKRTTDSGVPEIMLAPAGFSREALISANTVPGTRKRLSSLAG